MIKLLLFTLFGICVGIPFGCFLATDGKGHSKIGAMKGSRN